MKSAWQLKREKLERFERSIRFAICIVLICIVLILQSIAHGKLPSNLDELVVSPGAIGRLQEVDK